jgi:hypothetical protein
VLRNQFLKNLALLVALAWFPYSAQAHFLTKCLASSLFA